MSGCRVVVWGLAEIEGQAGEWFGFAVEWGVHGCRLQIISRFVDAGDHSERDRERYDFLCFDSFFRFIIVF